MKKHLSVVFCAILLLCAGFQAQAINHPPAFVGGHNQTLTVCENASATSINTLMAVTDIDAGQIESWIVIKGASHGTLYAGYSTTSTGGTLMPVGLSYTPTTGYSGADTFSVRITDGTASDTTTVILTITPLPSAGSITGASGVCIGSTITLTDAVTGGAWTVSNTTASVAGGVVTGITAGTDTINYTITTACGTATTIKAVTINPLPVIDTITGPSTVCVGATITLSDAITGGTWTVSNTNASIAGGIVTGVSTGSDTVTYKITTACGSATTKMTITVNPLPFAGSISPAGGSAICAGDSIMLSDAVSGGVWGRSNTCASVSVLGLVKGLRKGVDTIMYSVTNGCGTDVVSTTVTVNPLPDVGTIKGAKGVCVGGTITLTDPAAGGTWGSTDMSVAKISSTGVVAGLSHGTATIYYAITNGCGTDSAKFALSVDIPALPIFDSSSTVCQFTPMILLDLSPGGTWSSSVPTDFVIGGIFIGATPGPVTITYTVTNGCGTTKATVDITVIATAECNPPLNASPAATKQAGLEIYPNPNNGAFTLNMVTNTNEDVRVVIMNMVGEKVSSFITTTNKANELNLNLPSGVYFVTATTANNRYTGKVTITR